MTNPASQHEAPNSAPAPEPPHQEHRPRKWLAISSALFAIIIIAAVVAIGAAAGGAPNPTAHQAVSSAPAAATQPETAPPPAAPSSQASASSSFAPESQVLTCTAVVDPDPSSSGFNVSGLEADGFPSQLTAEQVIGIIQAMYLSDGLVNLNQGTPSSQDTAILDAVRLDLMNYSQATKLGTDAAQFASDEQSYNPDGPVDASYASPLQADMRALLSDCPKSINWALRIVHQ